MRRVALLFVLATAAFPPAAGAGRVDLDARRPQPDLLYDVLTYRAAPGERNRVTVTSDGPTVTLVDSAGVTPGRRCVATPGRHGTAATCTLFDPVSLGPVDLATLALGDRDDRARTAGCCDNVILAGGRGDDHLIGDSGFSNFFSGGPGRDRIVGRAAFELIDEGPRANGSDTMSHPSRAGGAWVDYGRRDTPIRADLDGERDDGAHGERDLLGPGIHSIRGGRASDRLVGNAERNELGGGGGADVLIGGRGNDALIATDVGPPRLLPGDGVPGDRTADRLLGGPGNDLLEGSNGPNVIDGGQQPDVIWALGGADAIHARDTDTDQVGCGAGPDRVWNDAIDFRVSCERATYSPPGAVPITAFAYIADRDPEPYGASFGIGCSVRVPCSGSLELRFRGDVVGRTRFSVTAPADALPIEDHRTEVFFKVTEEVHALLEDRNPELTVVTVTDGSGVRRETSVMDLMGDVGLPLPSLPHTSL